MSTSYATALPAPILTNRTEIAPAGVAADGISQLLGILRDGTLVANRGGSGNACQIAISRDGGQTWTFGTRFATSAYILDGIMETNDGEIIANVYQAGASGAAGRLYKTTGWNPATGTCTSSAMVLEASGLGVHFDARWGANQRCVAPAWSSMAGSILVLEYGTKMSEAVAAGRPNSQSAVHAYLSRDNGATWATVLDLRDYYTGNPAIHGHGCCVTLADKGWVVAHGDGGLSDGGSARLLFCADEKIDTYDPANWTPYDRSVGASGATQITTVGEFATGIVALSDSRPGRVMRVARRGYRRPGPLTSLLTVNPLALIGNRLHQNIDSPTAPIFATHANSSGTGKAMIVASLDGGDTWQVAYREAAAVTSGTGYATVVGPDARGKVYANYNPNGTSRVVVFDLVKPAPTEGVQTTRKVLAGPGLSGGGDFSADRALAAASAVSADRWGLLGHSFPIDTEGSTSSALTPGTLYVMKVRAEADAAAATRTVRLWQVVAASGLTLAKAAVYDASGALLGSASADASATFNGGGTTKRDLTVGSFAITAGQDLYVAFLVAGTTGPTLARGSGDGRTNIGLTGAALLWATGGTGLTDLPATITPASLSAQALALWVGIL